MGSYDIAPTERLGTVCYYFSLYGTNGGHRWRDKSVLYAYKSGKGCSSFITSKVPNLSPSANGESKLRSIASCIHRALREGIERTRASTEERSHLTNNQEDPDKFDIDNAFLTPVVFEGREDHVCIRTIRPELRLEAGI
jgi:hypothetical protein